MTNEIPGEPTMAQRFMRPHFALAAAGMVLAVYLTMTARSSYLSALASHQHEQQIVRQIIACPFRPQRQSAAATMEVGFLGTLFSRDRVGLVNLNDKAITDADLESFAELSKLKILRMDDTIVSDVGLEHLKSLKKIEILSLNGTQLTDVGLQHLSDLTRLRSLFLGNTEVSDKGLAHLKGLKKLKFVFLRETRTTAEGRASLRKALPNCRVMPDP